MSDMTIAYTAPACIGDNMTAMTSPRGTRRPGTSGPAPSAPPGSPRARDPGQFTTAAAIAVPRRQPPRIGPTEDQFLTAYGTRTALPDYPAVQAAAAATIAAHCARLTGTTHPQPLWQAASSLDTSTLFGAFKIDPATGAQLSHQTILLQWTDTNHLFPV